MPSRFFHAWVLINVVCVNLMGDVGLYSQVFLGYPMSPKSGDMGHPVLMVTPMII
jgi:hypothetical protein